MRLVDINNMDMSAEEYFNSLVKEKNEYLLEERVIQSEVMSRLNPSSVNTVRCITYAVGNDIRPEQCFIKIGRNGSFIDNGAAGGLLAGIDIKTGKLDTAGYTEFGEAFAAHPDTGTALLGYRLPQWDEMLALAISLSKKIPSAKFIGWDFAHTDSGWVVIECNGRSQLIGPQLLYGHGIKKEIQEMTGIKF